MPKARVVADTEMLWWYARQSCVMVAKLRECWQPASVTPPCKAAQRAVAAVQAPGPVLNKESLLLTPPMPAFSAFFTLLPFHTTTSLWALPFHSGAAFPRAPCHNLRVLCDFSWPEHLAEENAGAGEVRVSLRPRDTGCATGQLWWSLGTCQTCKLQAWG